MNLLSIRKRNKKALEGYESFNDFHKKAKNETILEQCWEYSLNKDIEFLLAKVDAQKKK